MSNRRVRRDLHEVRLLQGALSNAFDDLNSGRHLVSGRLCEDIESLGFEQSLAIDMVFNPSRADSLTRELAARVCESCIEWAGCSKRVLGELKMDESDALLFREEDRTISSQNLRPSLTFIRRQANHF